MEDGDEAVVLFDQAIVGGGEREGGVGCSLRVQDGVGAAGSGEKGN
ncbi:MAG: hypothetical protein AAF752_00815 [Bacteroidota bacterium]